MLDVVAFYARVSTEQQTQANTIMSQITLLKEEITNEKHNLLKEHEFIDEGFSGSTLMRPALERMRDAIANGKITKIYVHSPDRLARKYAYQYLLIEEFKKHHVDIIFLNHQFGDNPESNLLLQVQGIISEYERTKIMERSRRGKIHAAKRGSVSVLGAAPYGYDFITKQAGGGVARYDIKETEAKIIRQIFTWIGKENITMNGAATRLTEMSVATPTRKNNRWCRGTINRLVNNPAYKGKAAFGKLRCIPKRFELKPRKGNPIQSKHSYSLESMPKDKWIYIDVPHIVEEDLFDLVQEKLIENRKRKREQKTSVTILLRGLLVCKDCGYSYISNSATKNRSYYVCGGSRIYNENKEKECSHKSILMDVLNEIVWQEVICLLGNPAYIEKEYERRIQSTKKNKHEQVYNGFITEKSKLEKSINKLIDCYTENLINKVEFTPRIKAFKQRLHNIDQHLIQLNDNDKEIKELDNIMHCITAFSNVIKNNLTQLSLQEKREIIIALVKRVEIGEKEVEVIFRVDPYPITPTISQSVDDCSRSYNLMYTSKIT
jgi:site-specific DNA recombinase